MLILEILWRENKMSIHSSLKKRKQKSRSVLKRFERLKKAIVEGKWKEGDSVYNLPKYNPPKFKPPKKDEEVKTTTLGKVDLLEQHKLAKEKATKNRKQKKIKKEITGRK